MCLKVLGTPTKEELKSMNPSYQEFRFPMIRSHPWNTILKPHTPPDCLDLVSKLLVYVPSIRLKSIEVSEHYSRLLYCMITRYFKEC